MPERLTTRAFIKDENNKVLIGLRAHGIGANQWALVGGKPDFGELPEDAVVREVYEELGVNFSEVKLYLEKVDSFTDPNQQWRVFFYTGKVNGIPNPKLDEIAEIRYVSKEDLDDLDIAFDHRERLIEFFDALDTN